MSTLGGGGVMSVSTRGHLTNYHESSSRRSTVGGVNAWACRSEEAPSTLCERLWCTDYSVGLRCQYVVGFVMFWITHRHGIVFLRGTNHIFSSARFSNDVQSHST